MKKKEKHIINSDVNVLRETLVELAMPKFCSYCGTGSHDLLVEVIRGIDPDKSHYDGLTIKEYDVQFQVICGICGKSFVVQPDETKGLIDEYK